jgi:trans-2,3-dihydro-3-hydroxyanthranilate isomerase
MTDYVVYDVFTDTPFGGNQLAVIPDATGLNESDLQKIAAEFNFSETTFVYPPEDNNHTARVRIYTPTNEIPFAGHPTVGTAIALSDLGACDEIILELGVGPIPCTVTKGNPSTAEFTTKVPLEKFDVVEMNLIAACLSINANEIVTENHLPQMISVGLPFVMVELPDLNVLAATAPVTDAYKRGETIHGGKVDMFATFAYVKTGTGIQARMYAPLNNIPEDPATGSACAALGAYLTELTGKAQSLEISQGIEMDRPSYISVSTTINNGQASSVTVSGSAVKTMQGTLVF